MQDCLIMKTPAAWHKEMYREAAPTGNGIIGAAVYGGIAQELVAINHCALWEKGKLREIPDVSFSLAKTREGIDSGDYWNSNWISVNALKEAGYEGRLQNPCPLCDLRLDMPEREVFSGYRRIINMASGEVTVKWKEKGAGYVRRTFVSRSRDVVFMCVNGDKPFTANMRLNTHDTMEDDTKKKREELEGNFASISRPDGSFLYYAKCEDGTYYGAAAEVRTNGTKEMAEDGFVTVKATGFMVIVKPFIGETLENAQNYAPNFTEEMWNFEEMIKEHRALHEPLYRSAELELSDKKVSTNEELIADAFENEASPELLEKQWKFGRYLMICGTREDGLPFPLYGLWHGKYKMSWPHNMANENVQMIYRHTMAGGLHFATRTLIRYYFERMNTFRECAKKIFGLPGIYLPAGTTPGNCRPNQIVPVIMNWIGCAGWIAQHFYKYYLYTGDKELLHKEILPFMLEAAEFYAAFVVKEENGRYKIYPSVSPENTPLNFIPKDNPDMAHPCPSVVNATMDIAIIKELLMNLLELSKEGELNSDGLQEKAELWKDIVCNLPEYESTPDGDIREWQYEGFEERYNHRHLSHIYPVFPGDEVVKGRESEELIAAFEKAVDKRILGAQTGWSLSHMSCIYSRFEKPEKAIECIDIMSKSCLLNNFFTLHNDYRGMGLTLGRGSFAPIQLDAAMGCTEAIQEMLLYAERDFIKLLPAVPRRLSKGKVSNLRFMTGRISMSWDRGKFDAELVAERETKLKLLLPGFAGELRYVKVVNGEAVERGTIRSGEDFSLNPNEKLMLKL